MATLTSSPHFIHHITSHITQTSDKLALMGVQSVHILTELHRPLPVQLVMPYGIAWELKVKPYHY
jgi:hypothetical protein